CFFLFFFFFQAEDGIRDFHVTGVQTCALPICCVGPPVRQHEKMISCWITCSRERAVPMVGRSTTTFAPPMITTSRLVNSGPGMRSEERRVGKECRSRGAAYH